MDAPDQKNGEVSYRSARELLDSAADRGGRCVGSPGSATGWWVAGPAGRCAATGTLRSDAAGRCARSIMKPVMDAVTAWQTSAATAVANRSPPAAAKAAPVMTVPAASTPTTFCWPAPSR